MFSEQALTRPERPMAGAVKSPTLVYGPLRQGEILPESRQFRLRAVGLCASPVRLQHHGEVDTLAGSSWSTPQTVAGFAKSPPNARLMQIAADELKRRPEGRAI